jgi:hypothetical protein
MRDITTSHETYHFFCRRCSHAWEQAYDIRRWTDNQGQERVACTIAGAPVTAPWGEVSCPSCGGFQVSLVPEPGIRH